MKKIKEFIKSYAVGLIFGIITACSISVIAATYFPSNQTTYDNTNSKLKSENVQDAIEKNTVFQEEIMHLDKSHKKKKNYVNTVLN